MSDTRKGIEEISPGILPVALVSLFKKSEFKPDLAQGVARKEFIKIIHYFLQREWKTRVGK